jgi:hypothetical protein
MGLNDSENVRADLFHRVSPSSFAAGRGVHRGPLALGIQKRPQAPPDPQALAQPAPARRPLDRLEEPDPLVRVADEIGHDLRRQRRLVPRQRSQRVESRIVVEDGGGPRGGTRRAGRAEGFFGRVVVGALERSPERGGDLVGAQDQAGESGEADRVIPPALAQGLEGARGFMRSVSVAPVLSNPAGTPASAAWAAIRPAQGHPPPTGAERPLAALRRRCWIKTRRLALMRRSIVRISRSASARSAVPPS